MKVEGDYVFPTPPSELWGLLLNSDSLRSCIPGCESLEVVAPDEWTLTLTIGVGAIKGTYTGKVSITDKQEPTGYTLHVEGNGRPGWVKGSARVTLIPEGSGTHVTVDAEGQVGGMLAGVGQRMLGGAARMLMNQFFDCLKQRAQQVAASGSTRGSAIEPRSS